MKFVSTHFLLLVLTGVFCVSCNDNDIDYLESTTDAKQITVPNSAKINEQFPIDLVFFGTSGCSEFSRYKTTQIGDTTFFELFQRRNKALICSDAIIEIQVTITMSFAESGIKYLKFNDSSIFSDFTPELIESVQIEN